MPLEGAFPNSCRRVGSGSGRGGVIGGLGRAASLEQSPCDPAASDSQPSTIPRHKALQTFGWCGYSASSRFVPLKHNTTSENPGRWLLLGLQGPGLMSQMSHLSHPKKCDIPPKLSRSEPQWATEPWRGARRPMSPVPSPEGTFGDIRGIGPCGAAHEPKNRAKLSGKPRPFLGFLSQACPVASGR